MEEKKKRPKRERPTISYKFAASEPVEGRDAVYEQMRAAHRYRNKLCELELARRAASDAMIRSLFPEIEELDAKAKSAKEACDAVYERAKKASVEARSKEAAKAFKKEIAGAKSIKKAAFEALKAARKAAFASQSFKEHSDQIHAAWSAAQKEARSECGCFWGTYLRVEDSTRGFKSGAPPQFARYDVGRIAVQVQKDKKHRDNWFRVVPGDVWAQGTRRPKKLGTAMLWIRIGSNEDRTPIWAKFPFRMHREFDASTVCWVYVDQRRVGTKRKWWVVFVAEPPAGHGQRGTGTVGIDVGWRVQPSGAVRVGVWSGDDGQEGEILLPASVAGQVGKAQDLAAIRDRAQNEMAEAVKPYVTTRPEGHWMREATAHCHSWKAAARWAMLAIQWRDKREPGDEVAFTCLETWRKQDKHLANWRAHAMQRAQNIRRDVYRNLAAQLCKRYGTCAIENLNLKEVQRSADVAEDKRMKQTDASRNAALSILRSCLKERMEIVVVDAAYTSKTCHACGKVTALVGEVRYTCEHCGAEWDRDFNAARNILRRGLSECVPTG